MHSFSLLYDIIITVVVLGPKTRWSVEISFPTSAMTVSSFVVEALCLAESRSFMLSCPEWTKIVPCSNITTTIVSNFLDCGRECLQLPDLAGLKYNTHNNSCECFLEVAGLDLRLAGERHIAYCWVSQNSNTLLHCAICRIQFLSSILMNIPFLYRLEIGQCQVGIKFNTIAVQLIFFPH